MQNIDGHIIVGFVCSQVTQAGYGTGEKEWLTMVGGVLTAWRYALGTPLDPLTLKFMASYVDAVSNQGGYRKGGGTIEDEPNVETLMDELLNKQHDLTAKEFYSKFMEIKPFTRNNMLVGKIVYNLLNKTLHDPVDI